VCPSTPLPKKKKLQQLRSDKHVTARKYKILVIYVSPTALTKDMSTYKAEAQLQNVTKKIKFQFVLQRLLKFSKVLY